MLLAAVMVTTLTLSSYGAENEKTSATEMSDECIIFSNIENLNVGEGLEKEVYSSSGELILLGLTKTSETGNNYSILDGGSSSGSSETTIYKIYITTGVLNCHFYMKVTNNKVVSVYDEWILTVGGTYENASLIHTTTYGKLSFKYIMYDGLISSLCWLKATVTGSGNQITVTYEF